MTGAILHKGCFHYPIVQIVVQLVIIICVDVKISKPKNVHFFKAPDVARVVFIK